MFISVCILGICLNYIKIFLPLTIMPLVALTFTLVRSYKTTCFYRLDTSGIMIVDSTGKMMPGMPKTGFHSYIVYWGDAGISRLSSTVWNEYPAVAIYLDTQSKEQVLPFISEEDNLIATERLQSLIKFAAKR